VATNVNLTTFDYALKDLYDEARTVTAICAENPAYARCKKTPKFPERKHSFMVHYGAPARSATFTNAQSNRYPSKGLELQIKRGHDYCIGRIDTETMLASEDDPDRLRRPPRARRTTRSWPSTTASAARTSARAPALSARSTSPRSPRPR